LGPRPVINKKSSQRKTKKTLKENPRNLIVYFLHLLSSYCLAPNKDNIKNWRQRRKNTRWIENKISSWDRILWICDQTFVSCSSICWSKDEQQTNKCRITVV
jgi:hypothetical protein